jgi:DNA-binding NarL/FixJ family response regulator
LVGGSISSESLQMDTGSPPLLASRHREFTWGVRNIETLRDGGGGLILVSGPAGSGKSTLARVLQRHFGEDGVSVGATHRDLEPALGIWSRIAVVSGGPTIHADPNVDRFAAVVNLLRGSNFNNVPLVIDDLHAADPDSLTLLALLAPVLTTTGAVIVATTRGADTVSEDLGRAAHLAAESHAIVHTLEPLDRCDLRSWLDIHGGNTTPEVVVDTFLRESGGNPLLIQYLLLACWAPKSRPPEPEAIRRASTGRSVIERWTRELERLSHTDRDALRVIIELAGLASADTLRAVIPEREPMPVIQRLVAHGLIEQDTSANQITLTHPAIAEALWLRDGPTTTALHARLVEVLTASDADARTVLMHILRAGPYFSNTARARAAGEVVRIATDRGDIRAAAEAWDVALESGPVGPEDVLSAAEAWARAGDRGRACDLAWEVARAAGFDQAPLLTRTALLVADGADFHGTAGAAVNLLHRALESWGQANDIEALSSRVALLSALAPMEMTLPVGGPQPPVALDPDHLAVVDVVRWHWVTRPEIAQPIAQQAESLAAKTGVAALKAQAALVWRATHHSPQHAAGRRRRAEHARRHLAGTPHHAAALHAAALDALEAGDIPEMRIVLNELETLASTTGSASIRWRFGYTAAMLEHLSGQPRAAEATSDAANRYGVVAGEPGAVIVRLEQRTTCAVDRLEDVDTVVALGRNTETVSHPPLLCGVLHLLGELHLAGVPEAVIDINTLRRLVEHLATTCAREQNWGIAVAFAASAATAIGDAESAGLLLAMMDEVRTGVARESSGIVCLGHQIGLIGRLEILAGDAESGYSAITESLALDAAAGFQRSVLSHQVALLRAQCRDLDDTVLRQRAGEIATEAHHLGLHLLAAQAQRLGAASHDETFSSRQRAILAGLARRHTYQEIADQIGYSHGTVRSEVTQIYNRLGVDTREHAVAEARWRGLLAPQAPHLSGDIAMS